MDQEIGTVGVLPINTVSTKRNRIFNIHTARKIEVWYYRLNPLFIIINLFLILESAKLSRIHSLLSRISDENERRLSHVHQINSLLSDPCSSWEKMQIFDAVTRIQGNSSVFETVFEDIR